MLAIVEFAVQEVPDFDTIGEEGVPLARIVRGSPDTSDPESPASGPASCCSGARCWPGRRTRTS